MAGRARHSRADDHGSAEYDPGLTPVHEVALAGLTPSTTYHFQVESLDVEFSTAPAQIDLSGWTLLQFDSSQAYVFPPGTAIPGGGYLVLARDSGQAAFEVEWGPLPAGTIFLSSGGSFPFINGGESFELRDGGSLPVDGVTIAMASGTSIQRNHPGDPPGDDGVDGTATSYDMRSAPHPITSEAGFAAATPLVGEPSPATAGTTEVWEVPGLNPATSYYFALRPSDEVGNLSAACRASAANSCENIVPTEPATDPFRKEKRR